MGFFTQNDQNNTNAAKAKELDDMRAADSLRKANEEGEIAGVESSKQMFLEKANRDAAIRNLRRQVPGFSMYNDPEREGGMGPEDSYISDYAQGELDAIDAGGYEGPEMGNGIPPMGASRGVQESAISNVINNIAGMRDQGAPQDVLNNEFNKLSPEQQIRARELVLRQQQDRQAEAEQLVQPYTPPVSTSPINANAAEIMAAANQIGMTEEQAQQAPQQ